MDTVRNMKQDHRKTTDKRGDKLNKFRECEGPLPKPKRQLYFVLAATSKTNRAVDIC